MISGWGPLSTFDRRWLSISWSRFTRLFSPSYCDCMGFGHVGLGGHPVSGSLFPIILCNSPQFCSLFPLPHPPLSSPVFFPISLSFSPLKMICKDISKYMAINSFFATMHWLLHSRNSAIIYKTLFLYNKIITKCYHLQDPFAFCSIAFFFRFYSIYGVDWDSVGESGHLLKISLLALGSF